MYAKSRRRSLTHAAVAAVALGLALAAPSAAVHADDLGSRTLAGATSVGLHNTYNDKTPYTYLADALDSGATLIELDAWANPFTRKWNVSHSSPLASNNNCVQAGTAADLYTGDRNQNLDSCLDDIRIWMQAHPTHNPIMVKLELKEGFNSSAGLDATELDSYVKAHLGDLVYTPADLLTKADGSRYPDLDTAARADNWATRAALAGKVIVEAIPGTVEQSLNSSSTWTDVVEAAHLKSLYAAGNIADAEIFPSVLNAQAGDPRTRYSDTTLRPWFVVFDGDAGAWVGDGNTEWYNTNHYLAVVTDAYDVAPALSSSAPTLADAQARVALLAADGASFVSTDWFNAPGSGVLGEVLARG
ncbi:Ca2+-dependent phosphoinositide-specific phospholipase C [Streptacidiphilus carbonis]|uniref:Ca2+-dependent phosphoinositide-specific phospholipase C n=1 Tax=Streptacidiphilus carbonis TaxID=105422 RepID=UPI0005A83958|nr:Ca2+-dependent phosphoinositide-specific phospholipase C [Streptacidiphilus carbonis]